MQNGAMNSLVFLAGCVTLATSAKLSEWIIARGWLSRTRTRKAFVAVSYFGTSICLIAVPWVGCSERGVVALMVAQQFFNGVCAGGDTPMPGEMSKNFPATIYGIMNTIAMSSGFVAPTVIGKILDAGDNKLRQWNIVFITSGVTSIVGAIVFIVFAEAEVIMWLLTGST